jgi:putative endonuclease
MTMANDIWYVYILVSKTGTNYTGVTNDMERRLWEHKTASAKASFARRYSVNKLVYLEEFGDVNDAIACEKRIKGWTRAKKHALITGKNPEWRDLATDFQQGLPEN